MSNLDLGNNEFINYKFHENSEKPTIVFSNSLGSDLNMWNPQVEFFKNDYQLVLYDKRGHGKSSPIQGPYNFDMLENDVISIMDELNITTAHFVGLSMGGMTSLGLALKYPDRFNKMVCCAARADMPPPAIESWDQRMAVVEEKGTEGVVQGSIERWFSDEFRNDSSNSDIINKAGEMIKSTSVQGYIGSCNAIKGLDYLRELAKIKKDFLFVSGENDVGAPALAMEEMHHLTVNSKYVCIPGVAHVFNLEKPNETNKILSDFLN